MLIDDFYIKLWNAEALKCHKLMKNLSYKAFNSFLPCFIALSHQHYESLLLFSFNYSILTAVHITYLL
jgi:hypothetical protein